MNVLRETIRLQYGILLLHPIAGRLPKQLTAFRSRVFCVRGYEMPNVGEFVKARDIGLRGGGGHRRYTWSVCAKCGEARWTPVRKHGRTAALCSECNRRSVGTERCAIWKGGRVVDRYGYVYLWSCPSEYAPMMPSNGYIHEHRLVMAMHLGRCLARTEIVHHKNGIKDDNRIDNLELYPNNRMHMRKCHEKKTSA
jgi:hypothetical protein